MEQISYNDIKGEIFEKKIIKELENNDICIFGKNINVRKNKADIIELDILLNKFIIECKSGKINFKKERKKLTCQINKFYFYFPNYKVILWLDYSYKEHFGVNNIDEFKNKFNIIHPNLYIINTIDEFIHIYDNYNNYYIEDNHINSIIGFISNKNKINYDKIYKRIYVHRNFIDKFKNIIIEQQEIVNFNDFCNKINIVDDDYNFTNYIKITNHHYLKKGLKVEDENIENIINNYIYFYIDSFSLEYINISNFIKFFGITCIECKKKVSNRYIMKKTNICKKCFYKNI
jgi:hypothetical protein